MPRPYLQLLDFQAPDSESVHLDNPKRGAAVDDPCDSETADCQSADGKRSDCQCSHCGCPDGYRPCGGSVEIGRTRPGSVRLLERKCPSWLLLIH